MSASTVSRVLAGKANTSDKARRAVLTCARDMGVLEGIAAGRMLLNSTVVFAPQRAFDERSDIYYYRVIQSIHHALAAHEVRLRTCALEEVAAMPISSGPHERTGNRSGDPAGH